MGAGTLKAREGAGKLMTLHQHILSILGHASSNRTTGARACTHAAALVSMLGPR